MKLIIVNMQNYLMSQAIENALKQVDGFRAVTVERPEKVTENCLLLEPNLLLMEVTGHPLWNLDEWMQIRAQVGALVPTCKIVLVVDENTDREVAEQIKEAKKRGLIDLFIFGSTSINYLIALMETL